MTIDILSTARAAQRLRAELTAWLTTVRADGQPQSSPVGFLWDGDHLLILSQPDAPKVRNLRANPKAALHLDTDVNAADDGGVLTIEGTAALAPARPTETEASSYTAKYRDVIEADGLTADQVFAEYSQTIRITPTRARLY